MLNIICPDCGENLEKSGNSLVCQNRHCFDFSKDGYVNLLKSGKNGALIGDNRSMALSRRDFLNKGYYDALARELKNEYDTVKNDGFTAVDICCGEGYYTQFISENAEGAFYGFDISKEMIRLGAKRKCNADFFVANMKSLPLKSGSVDLAFHLFAPFCEDEFSRILSENGRLISVTGGREHLWGLKEVLYDVPYENEESLPEYDKLRLIEQKRVTDTITLTSNEDIYALFKMTPYYYHTNRKHKERLDGIDTLTTKLDFVLNIFEKAED
ncbi:MAG: methyltransferase domain-containing protein [Clostridia bacterium]|nr:methyltransferase domain-containing protein [Clostridia bacterium]